MLNKTFYYMMNFSLETYIYMHIYGHAFICMHHNSVQIHKIP